MLWVVSTTLVWPSLQVSLILPHINLLATGSIPVDGSPNMIMLGLPSERGAFLMKDERNQQAKQIEWNIVMLVQ